MNKSEARIAQDCYMWFQKEFPQYRRLYNLNLNNSGLHLDKEHRLYDEAEQLNIRIANSNKAQGLQAGRSDAVFYFNKVAYHIEFKTEKGTQGPKQKLWESCIRQQGFQYHIIRSLDEFKQLILSICG